MCIWDEQYVDQGFIYVMLWDQEINGHGIILYIGNNITNKADSQLGLINVHLRRTVRGSGQEINGDWILTSSCIIYVMFGASD